MAEGQRQYVLALRHSATRLLRAAVALERGDYATAAEATSDATLLSVVVTLYTSHALGPLTDHQREMAERAHDVAMLAAMPRGEPDA